MLLVNLGMLGGCVVAAFILPPTTRLSVFGFSCLFVVVVFNVYLYFKGYRRVEATPSGDSATTKSPRNWWRIFLIAAVWVYLIFEFFKYHIQK